MDVDDELLSFVALSVENNNLLASPVKARNAEFNMKNASPEDRIGFKISDLAEWKAIVDMKAVKVLAGKASADVLKHSPHRIVTSRMIRRKKPTPGIGNFKFKSRWCVHGHTDPDSHQLQTYSPMPCTEAISMFFQVCVNLSLSGSFADVSNAFCQANKLDRPEGKLYVRPCEGLDLPADAIIELVAPVYGLDDAPIRWRQTLLEFFQSLGFERTLLEPCWLVKRERGRIIAMVWIEVDDINIGNIEEYQQELRDAMESRFAFGKWEHSEADFAGRHVQVLEDRVLLNQEKYILEKIIPVKTAKGRLGDKTQLLSEDEFEQYRSLLYKINWVARQTRPEAAGAVSILSSRLRKATIHDLCCVNKLAVHLRNTAQQHLTLHKFDNEKMIFIAASDAGGVDSVPMQEDANTDTVQGAWVIMASDSMPSASHKAKVSILSWRSSKLRRRVSSTLAGEALAFSQALGEMEWLQVMFRDVVHNDVNRLDWRQTLLPFIGVLRDQCVLQDRLQQCSITDAKSLFDTIKKGNPTSRQDRRISVELAIITEVMGHTKGLIRWSPRPRMIADALTKDDIAKSNGAPEAVLRTGRFSLWVEDSELERRKDPKNTGTSKRASERIHEEGISLFEMFDRLHVNKSLGELSNFSST